ncbi:MAG: hypothetical protein SPI06_12535 [Terrisporobacter sp.]|uniref:hypothetical protein n=1 Tax=Terrisporobacter sp. TaxID=1965305 RepID=UPI002A91986B|nr:hypothetical protein [Terrisporobacter sp.]MCI7208025.1 hypothetical protein [Clostridium sp.]MDY6154225.1 hypothetical protein [Terrisporobacter sp.]
MKLIKKIYTKMIQLKEMITDEKGYRYNKALYEITDNMVLATRVNDTDLERKYVNEFNLLRSYGYKAWKGYKKLDK